MKLKVGDKVTHSFDKKSIGIVTDINEDNEATIKWNVVTLANYPWTLDGKFSGKTACLRILSPLEQLI